MYIYTHIRYFFVLLPIQWWFAQMLTCMAGWKAANND